MADKAPKKYRSKFFRIAVEGVPPRFHGRL